MLLGGGSLSEWVFVCSGLDMNVRIHGLTAEYCNVVS